MSSPLLPRGTDADRTGTLTDSVSEAKGQRVSENEPTIRNVTFCECGKPSGHTTICAPPRRTLGLGHDSTQRVPVTFEEQSAERARSRYERRRRDYDAARRTQRDQMTTLELHRWIVERAATLSTVPGRGYDSAPVTGTREKSVGPPRQSVLDDNPDWREHERIVRKRLLSMAQLVDAELSAGNAAAAATMDGTDKDKLILSREHRGLRAQAVVDLLGEGIAGSAETVRRVRRTAGLDALGNEREAS